MANAGRLRYWFDKEFLSQRWFENHLKDRPCRARFDWACARCSVPDIDPAPSRFLHVGFQYCSSAAQTGFQY
jgi:hypothetical protein